MIQQKSHPYVRDDTIFIKIMVYVGDMSKAPIRIQQLLVEKEVMLLQQSIETDFDKDHFNGKQIGANLDFDMFTSIFTFNCLITSSDLRTTVFQEYLNNNKSNIP
ncbi:unnamed protein product [Rotaria socialis]|uniref:Uncharacterized protein n=1 Tax=Rotaria socialis TaxID=392032 RepID=A0A820ZQN3_9BILA|nr:unnamed protein product [Rotaria socialis]